MGKDEGNIDSYPDNKVISEEALAEWIDESVSTLQNGEELAKVLSSSRSQRTLATVLVMLENGWTTSL